MTFRKLLILTILATLLAACSPADHINPPGDLALPENGAVSLASGEKLTVVATTSFIGDVAAQVAGDAINLTTLIGVGQDPHGFEPTPQDLAAIERADLILVNGLGLEEVLLEAIGETAAAPVVPVSAGIEPLGHNDEHEEKEEDHEEGEDHGHTAGDPHFWVDPNNVIIWVENIRQALSVADPNNAELYAANAAAYRQQLEELDAYIRQQVETIPPANRELITDHGTFSYFAEEYGFEMIGTVIPGFTTTAGPSAGDLADLLALIAEHQVPAIFVGETAPESTRKLAATLAVESGTEIQVLTLLTGSLAPAGQPGDTYLGYMRYNIEKIAAGLSE
jgi:ABC-type Zn uptake system ZnuABC Zn-binding protein ZnuA